MKYTIEDVEKSLAREWMSSLSNDHDIVKYLQSTILQLRQEKEVLEQKNKELTDEILKLQNLETRSQQNQETLEARQEEQSAELNPSDSILQKEIEYRRHIEEELKRTNIFLNSIVENIPNMIFVKDAKDLRFVLFNKAGEELLGYRREELLNKNDYDFFPKKEADFFTQKDRKVFLQKGLEDIPEELIHTRSKGTRYLHTKKVPILDEQENPLYLLGISEDITHRKALELSLRHHLAIGTVIAQISQMFVSQDAPDYNLILERLGQTVSVHRAYIFQFDTEGQFFSNIYEWSASNTESSIDRIQHLKTVQYAWLVGQLQSQKPVLVSDINNLPPEAAEEKRLLETHHVHAFVCVPICSKQAKLIGFIGFDDTQKCRDWRPQEVQALHIIAEMLSSFWQRKQTEETLKITQQKMIEQERLQALGTMARGIAHDFNNALSPILGYSDLLLVYPDILHDQEKTLAKLKKIHTAAKEAVKVVNRLRDFYRHRDDAEVFQPIDLNQAISQVLLSMQTGLQEESLNRGIFIQIQNESTQIPQIVGNEAQLSEVLINLLNNAVDAMPEGGNITISTQVEENFVLLAVKDTGSGMSEDVRKRCLEPFFSTKEQRGTGLGLAIVYGIVQRHQGKIDIESSVGKGTTVQIRLPLYDSSQNNVWQPVTPKLTKEVHPTASVSNLANVNSLHILVVEDNALVRSIIGEFLTLGGHQIEMAENGREGLEKFHTSSFDLVITDRAMPELNGDQLAMAVKQIDPSKPIIMLTGFGEMMEAAGELPAGVDVILSKPVTRNALLRALAKVTSDKPTNDGLK